MKFGGCTWIMNIMHGRLHHLRMLALMLTPFARSLMLVQVALLLCVDEFKLFPYNVFGSMAPVV
jgi:hypothetical protein